MDRDLTEREKIARREFSGGQLGDKRLQARLEVIAAKAVARPSESLPKQAGTVAALEATYRFLGNERVSSNEILAPHQMATVSRAAAEKHVLVVHDTTEFDFGKREALGELNGFRKGFLGHYSLAVSGDGSRRPLGILNIESVFREDLARTAGRRRGGGRQSEAGRWYRGVDRSREALEDQPHAIHVCDREADSIELFEHFLACTADFVIRMHHDRMVDEDTRVLSVLDAMPVIAERTASLSERSKNPSPTHRARHPPRKPRSSRLQISASRFRLKPGVELNLVRVREQDVPDGESPVEWLLWTTLPINTAEDVFHIVDCYRARWVIEEYFKALKTGCSFEKLQLESRHGLLNALAVFTPVAWLLLHLRSTARTSTSADVADVLSADQVHCLRAVHLKLEGKHLPRRLRAREALLAVARLGGHLKQNGEPGWMVLGRGMHDLLMFEMGFRLARGDL